MNRIILQILLLVIFAPPSFALTPIEVIKIVDGDTIKAKINKNIFSIRLTGIDCFETSKIHRAYKQAYQNNLAIEDVVIKGKNSKEFLENLYQNSNKNVYLDFKGLDIYGRALGVVYFDSKNINEMFKQEGGCLIYNY